MRAPEVTYHFQQPKDLQGPQLEPFQRSVDLTALSASFSHFFITNLALDRALVITNAVVSGLPGDAQHVEELRLFTITPAQQIAPVAGYFPPGTANQREALNWQGEVTILGGGPVSFQIQASFVFNAAVAANRIIASVMGYTIPRANMANG